MAKNIFRKVSLERLRSPEQLDQLIKVTSAQGWAIIVAIALLLIAGITWGVLGEVHTRVEGQGILLTGGGIRNLVHHQGGRITDINVGVGDFVEKGDTVARIEKYEIIDRIHNLREKLSNTEEEELREQLKQQIVDLQQEYEYQTSITSSYRGRVLEVSLNRGHLLQPGETILSIERTGAAVRELIGIIYVSPYESRNITPGMEAKVSPTFVKKEEYGFIHGRVISVSEFPVTSQQMMSVLGSRELVEIFSQAGAPVEVRIELMTDDSTYSGYSWTSPAGPPVKISSGTLSMASITIFSQRPIEMVIPVKIGNDG